MATTVVALYDDVADAQDAVKELVESGFPREEISLMVRDARGETRGDIRLAQEGAEVTPPEQERAEQMDENVHDTTEGAGIGAVLGGLTGLVIGIGAMAIPGIGPVLAAGPLIAALTGAGLGAAAGGMIGALTSAGIPEQQANEYAEGIRRGGTLVTVRTTDDTAEEAADILEKYNPIDIDERVSQWRSEGWTGFRTDQRGQPERDAQGNLIVPVSASRPQVGDDPAHYGEREVPEYIDETIPVQDTEEPPSDFQRIEPTFKNHFAQNFPGTGFGYSAYREAYRFGFDQARNARFQVLQWIDAEPILSEAWTDQHQDQDWHDIQRAVKQGWMVAREEAV